MHVTIESEILKMDLDTDVTRRILDASGRVYDLNKICTSEKIIRTDQAEGRSREGWISRMGVFRTLLFARLIAFWPPRVRHISETLFNLS